jgi:hypothetical protein
VPLPETIPVRYTEEEAGYVTVRPVVRQTFRLGELLDMILSVAGKDVPRVRQLLHSGTVVYHFYRYSWEGIEASEEEVFAALARFPDADPSRLFSKEACTLAIFESGGVSPRHLVELDRDAAGKRGIFRKQSFWESLLEIAATEKLRYRGYSYGRKADIYCLDLDGGIVAQIEKAIKNFAPRKLQTVNGVLPLAASILFVCPRPK